MTRPPAHAATLTFDGDVDGVLRLLDQTLLPQQTVILDVRDLATLVDAIRRLAVRGAPAIGVAAAYGMLLGVRERVRGDAPPERFRAAIDEVATILIGARPTAVNLAWAVERVRDATRTAPTLAKLLAEARAIHDEDVACCAAIGAHGAPLIRDGATVLTHCNAGRLATTGDGTALALLYAAARAGRRFRVLADETRPLLQGARLTAYELAAAGIPVEVVVDSAAAGLIASGAVDLVVTGADRIARNGDVVNKVGTYGVALAAAAHGVPLYVAAPSSTFDLALADGRAIPIEDRAADEVLRVGDRRTAPDGVGARNPAFDLTPARLVSALVTERGLIQPVDEEHVKALIRPDR